MIGMAHSRGADAVSEAGFECIACFLLISSLPPIQIVAMRFDSTGQQQFSEVCAYGTAVKYVNDS